MTIFFWMFFFPFGVMSSEWNYWVKKYRQCYNKKKARLSNSPRGEELTTQKLEGGWDVGIWSKWGSGGRAQSWIFKSAVGDNSGLEKRALDHKRDAYRHW